MSTLGFTIDPPDDLPRRLLEEDGGIRPATTDELALWDALQAAEANAQAVPETSAAMALDALRYRWLRAAPLTMAFPDFRRLESLDAAIDAALSVSLPTAEGGAAK